jgi:HAD superfamily hydrolase (TIGR01484 family)
MKFDLLAGKLNFRPGASALLGFSLICKKLCYPESMKKITEFQDKLQFLATDIDDTLTSKGLLEPEAFSALWALHNKGIHVVPITGRPAGWCELIARQWPVAGVVGENGAFYFRYHQGKMHRQFAVPEHERLQSRNLLKKIEKEILTAVPECAVASDQFCRLFDLAIDFCEDVSPLTKDRVQKIVEIFTKHGARAKVSSIHVNGWFGNFDKLTQTLFFLKQEFQLDPERAKSIVGFCGDSPNDEPMFEFFPNSFGVSNIQNFLNDIKTKPTYVSDLPGGKGFSQICKQILSTESPL